MHKKAPQLWPILLISIITFIFLLSGGIFIKENILHNFSENPPEKEDDESSKSLGIAFWQLAGILLILLVVVYTINKTFMPQR